MKTNSNSTNSVWQNILTLFIEARRTAPAWLAVGIYWLFNRDAPALTLLCMVGAVIAAAVLFVHFARKFLYPYLDLEKFVKKALEEPFASMGIVSGMLWFTLELVRLAVTVALGAH